MCSAAHEWIPFSEDEQCADSLKSPRSVAKKFEIPESGVIGVEVEGKRLALINLNGEIYAIDDDCPHEGGPLSEGQIVGEEIECPWHTSHFNIKTGRVTIDPATN